MGDFIRSVIGVRLDYSSHGFLGTKLQLDGLGFLTGTLRCIVT